MSEDIERILQEQRRYYEDRAAEYDDVWFRLGIYDLGPEGNRRWYEETARLEAALDSFAPTGVVLELAAGTGLFTRHLAPHASRLIAIDSAAAALEINRDRLDDDRIEYQQADLFEWEPPDGVRFDAIVFAFLISHIVPERFDEFWQRLAGWLSPDGRVFFCDDLAGAQHRTSTIGEDVHDGEGFAHRRRLTDGREYTIVKLYYAPGELEERLAGLGWRADVRTTGSEFFHGIASIGSTPPPKPID
jgi:SAM-dependent methyltransferase